MIKAGYQITITSWENDGDNYNNITLSGLTKARVTYIIAMCKLFTSTKHGNLYDSYCNSAEVSLAQIDMAALASAYTDVVDSDELDCLFLEPVEYMTQFLGNGEYFTFRVFDSYKVHYIPVDIADVTHEFQ